MPRNWPWALAAVLALTIGVLTADTYARLMTPLYLTATKLIASMHPWKVLGVDVWQDRSGHGAMVRLVAEVREQRTDPRPAAIAVGRVAVGEVVETPLVFWTVVLAWPARSVRERLLRFAVGVPVFLALEIGTTACQLLSPLAETSAILAGDQDPLTLWERWSRFLEAGGRFALEVAAAILTVAAAPLRRPA